MRQETSFHKVRLEEKAGEPLCLAPNPISSCTWHSTQLYHARWALALTGGPGCPVSPFSPFSPGLPGRPSSPFIPAGPGFPGGPWGPGGPISPGLPRGPSRKDQQHILDTLMADRGEECERMGCRGPRGLGSLVLYWTRQRVCAAACGNLRGLGHQPWPIPAWVCLAPPGASSGHRGASAGGSPPPSLPHKVCTQAPSRAFCTLTSRAKTIFRGLSGHVLTFSPSSPGGPGSPISPCSQNNPRSLSDQRRAVTLIYIALAVSGVLSTQVEGMHFH